MSKKQVKRNNFLTTKTEIYDKKNFVQNITKKFNEKHNEITNKSKNILTSEVIFCKLLKQVENGIKRIVRTADGCITLTSTELKANKISECSL